MDQQPDAARTLSASVYRGGDGGAFLRLPPHLATGHRLRTGAGLRSAIGQPQLQAVVLGRGGTGRSRTRVPADRALVLLKGNCHEEAHCAVHAGGPVLTLVGYHPDRHTVRTRHELRHLPDHRQEGVDPGVRCQQDRGEPGQARGQRDLR